MTKTSQQLKLEAEIKSLDLPIKQIRESLTGEDLDSVLQRDFLAEFQRLLSLVAESEELSAGKITKMLQLVSVIRSLAAASQKVAATELHKQVNEISDFLRKSIDEITATNYGIWSPTYNKLFYFSEVTSWQLEVKRILTLINTSVDTSSDFAVLDIGTGTGFPSLLISRLYPRAQVFAFDNSAQMLEMARQFELAQRWDTNELSLTGLMQSYLDDHQKQHTAPHKIQFVHSPIVTLPPRSIDVAVMATTIPSYTPFTKELIQSIYESLKPGGRAMINFSVMSISRFILLWRDYGLHKARAEYRKHAVIDVITEPTEDGKQVFSFKVSFPRQVCEQLLQDAGFKIIKRHSMFPLLYLMLALGRQAMATDHQRIRAPYMYLNFPKNFFQKVWVSLLWKIDSFLARWPLPTAYELHFEVIKPTDSDEKLQRSFHR